MWTIFIVEIVTEMLVAKNTPLLTCSTTVHLETYERIPDIPSQVTAFFPPSVVPRAGGTGQVQEPLHQSFSNSRRFHQFISIHLWLDWLPVAICCLVKGLKKKIEAWCWNRYFLTKNVVFGLHGALSEPKHRTATVKDMLTLMELWLIRTLVRYPQGRAPRSLKLCFFEVKKLTLIKLFI